MALTGRQLMKMSPAELDELFAASPAGVIPDGRGHGTVLVFPGTAFVRPVAAAIRALFWQGKLFRAPTHDLVNLLSPFGRQGIRAETRADESVFDGRPCILLDYSTSSRAARDVRDEIRQIGENQYLGIVYRKGRKLRVYFVLAFAPVARADAPVISRTGEAKTAAHDPNTHTADGDRESADANTDKIK